jgi:antitoxin ParD1/3/4
MNMNVSLTPELDQFVQNKITSGLYKSASEVVREGLRLLHARDKLKDKQLEALKTDIHKGVASLEAGEGVGMIGNLFTLIKERGEKKIVTEAK